MMKTNKIIFLKTTRTMKSCWVMRKNQDEIGERNNKQTRILRSYNNKQKFLNY